VKLKLAVRSLQSRICAQHGGERAKRKVTRRTRGGELVDRCVARLSGEWLCARWRGSAAWRRAAPAHYPARHCPREYVSLLTDRPWAGTVGIGALEIGRRLEWGEGEYARDRRRWMVAMAVAVGGGGGRHHDLTFLYMFRSHS
jgi:hypothetical protein